MALELQMELAAQHCLGLKELGRDLALLVPPELEKQVCTDLNEDQLRKDHEWMMRGLLEFPAFQERCPSKFEAAEILKSLNGHFKAQRCALLVLSREFCDQRTKARSLEDSQASLEACDSSALGADDDAEQDEPGDPLPDAAVGDDGSDELSAMLVTPAEEEDSARPGVAEGHESEDANDFVADVEESSTSDSDGADDDGDEIWDKRILKPTSSVDSEETLILGQTRPEDLAAVLPDLVDEFDERMRERQQKKKKNKASSSSKPKKIENEKPAGIKRKRAFEEAPREFRDERDVDDGDEDEGAKAILDTFDVAYRPAILSLPTHLRISWKNQPMDQAFGMLMNKINGPKATLIYSNYKFIKELYVPLPDNIEWSKEITTKHPECTCNHGFSNRVFPTVV
ncbi:unnamed protein product [Symbiodinium pilosum]|uniref:Uncharacterized protein n=1 Tax=Symbiodinium pilosum TaxID=2952 RepID=A0A812Q6P0_SYMPI|nr:unnamed protein product [Symbiodinium pilosum]